MKTCTRCRKSKPYSAFGRRKASSDGYRAACRDCVNQANRASYADDPDTKKASVARSSVKHRDRRNASARRWYALNREWRAAVSRLKAQRRRAAARGACVGAIDLDAVLAPVNCYLCQQSLSGEIHLDHVVPLARGGAHATGNLLPTHGHCNRRKGDRLLHELVWYNGATNIGSISPQRQLAAGEAA